MSTDPFVFDTKNGSDRETFGSEQQAYETDTDRRVRVLVRVL